MASQVIPLGKAFALELREDELEQLEELQDEVEELRKERDQIQREHDEVVALLTGVAIDNGAVENGVGYLVATEASVSRVREFRLNVSHCQSEKRFLILAEKVEP